MTAVKIDRDDLADIVAFAARGLPKSAAQPILLAMRIIAKDKTLTVSAFDYDTYASANAPIKAGTFEALVSGLTLTRYVAALPAGEVTIDREGDILRMTAGRTKIALHAMTGSDYPTAPDRPADIGTVDSHELWNAASHVKPCVDPNASLHIMRGIFMETTAKEMTVIGLDNRHVAKRTLAWKGKAHDFVAIPLGVADCVKALDGTVTVSLDDGTIGLRDERHAVIGRLIAGEPPRINAAIDRAAPTIHVTVNRAEMIEAVRFASLGIQVSNKDFKSVQIEMTSDSISVSMTGNDSHDASSTIEAVVVGEPFDLKADPVLFVQALEVTDAEMVALGFKDAKSNIIITTEADPAAYAMLAPKAK